MTTTTATYVVVDGHTLGAVIGSSIQILRASILRGAGDNTDQVGLIDIPTAHRMRPATLQDFADFRVSPHGHLNPEGA